MKKATALLTIALLGALDLNAQNDKSLRLGLMLCPNMGWLNTDVKGYANDGTRLGFRFGLTSDFKIGSNANYFFSTGLFLNNVGAKSVTTGTDTMKTVYKSEMKLQYVELPITIKLKTNEIGYMTYFGQIGFDAGLRVSAKANLNGGDFEDAADFTNILRVALVVGAGLEYNFSGNTSALVGLKYSNAFTKVNDSDGADAKVHYAELTLGVLF